MDTSQSRRKTQTPEYDARANLAPMLHHFNCFFQNRNLSSSKTHMTGPLNEHPAAPALDLNSPRSPPGRPRCEDAAIIEYSSSFASSFFRLCFLGLCSNLIFLILLDALWFVRLRWQRNGVGYSLRTTSAGTIEQQHLSLSFCHVL